MYHLPASSDGRDAAQRWRIAFVRNDRVFFVNADGSGQRRAGIPGYPTYSPDGGKMTFAVDYSPAYAGRLYVAKADGTSRRAISARTDPCFAPNWSPDGKRIAYSTGCEVDFTDIFVVRRDGTARRRLTPAGYLPWEKQPIWSPNGRAILYTGFVKGCPGWQLFLMDPDGRRRRPIAGDYPKATDSFYAAEWSRDGKRIFFVSNKDLFVIDVDGTHLRRLTPVGMTVGAFDLSPDERTLAFSGAQRSGRKISDREILVMNIDGSDVHQLTDNSAHDADPMWSSDGRMIVFTSQRDANSEIYVMNADGSSQLNVSRNSADDISLSWVPAR
jgi:TolB protein